MTDWFWSVDLLFDRLNGVLGRKGRVRVGIRTRLVAGMMHHIGIRIIAIQYE
jgi:hypothetical protein